MTNRGGTLYENFDFDAAYQPKVPSGGPKTFHAPQPGEVDVLIRLVEGPYRNGELVDPDIRETDIDVSFAQTDAPVPDDVQFAILRCSREYAAHVHFRLRNLSALGPNDPAAALESLLTTGTFDYTKEPDWTGNELHAVAEATIDPVPVKADA